MSDYREQIQGRSGAAQSSTRGAVIDQGLRSYMLRVYNLMALGLAITGIAALGTSVMAQNNPAFAQALYGSHLNGL